MKTLNDVMNRTWEENGWVESWSKYILKTIPWKSINGSWGRETASVEIHDVVFSNLRTIHETISRKTREFANLKILIE